MISTSKMNILCIDKTKLDTTFTDSQFKIDGYQLLLLEKTDIRKGVGK